VGESVVGLAAGALGAAGLAGVAAAQNATPAADQSLSDPQKQFLFVQSFQKGNIVPKFGVAGTYTLTLEQGLGQTIYFANRPERTVGTLPTPDFLAGLGFPTDNPPNAALVLEAGPGDEDIAVVELFNPRYDIDSHTATYDIQVLQHHERLDMTFQEQPTDLAELHPTFGAAHLFIDDCADATVACCSQWDNYWLECVAPTVGTFPSMGYCYSWAFAHCMPCEPYDHNIPPCKGGCNPVLTYWADKCNHTYGACNGICQPIFYP
jgi:hypothetical protein